MLSAERHFEIARRLNEIYTIAHVEVPGADDVQIGNHTPLVFANTRRRARDFVAGDTFSSLTGIVGVLTPIEWEVVETTPRDQLLTARRGRFQVVSKWMQGATITIVLNIYEGETSVSADLFVLIDEVLLSGGLHHSFMVAVEHKIDSVISIAKRRFAALQDAVVDEKYPPQGPNR
ncbi:hypothetical protein [Mycobacteroides saopaulense]|uniref:Polyketide cyclase / dehydrase and lipid transport n=1 Tax=Mycobacteroides saopaulense TaxID=1578165 RepID=A0ABX3BZI1_9MYCO|nr:hypothetical protein [Mycobacteroides saopaulense]OHT81621.1 hypothetical protein BKG68_22070 [Mycobacteroides saopaulense]OHU09149.1 hypothetical protein BKG73_14030 [Mycobacteroides saopaulense]